MDDPEVGLTKLRTQVFMWEENYKRLQDGMPEDAPAHQVRHVVRNTLMLLDEAIEYPQEFKAQFQSRFGPKLQELDLLATSDFEDSLLEEEPVITEKEGQQTKAGEGQGTGAEDTQFGPKPNNAGDESPFEFQFKGGDEGGEGPGGDGVGNQNQSGPSGNQNQGSSSGGSKP
jgi:hypothetical protein